MHSMGVRDEKAPHPSGRSNFRAQRVPERNPVCLTELPLSAPLSRPLLVLPGMEFSQQNTLHYVRLGPLP